MMNRLTAQQARASHTGTALKFNPGHRGVTTGTKHGVVGSTLASHGGTEVAHKAPRRAIPRNHVSCCPPRIRRGSCAGGHENVAHPRRALPRADTRCALTCTRANGRRCGRWRCVPRRCCVRKGPETDHVGRPPPPLHMQTPPRTPGARLGIRESTSERGTNPPVWLRPSTSTRSSAA